MNIKPRMITYYVKCHRFIVEEDGNMLDDIMICFNKGKAFLYVKNGSVERFEKPEIPQEQETETPEKQIEQ